MHSIGYPDLYRSRGTGAPVGGWDIMASVSSFVQYPLSYLRSAISGWISIDTITQNGTYTLKPSSNSGDNQALILKTPISEKEFFVVEYRKAGTPYKDQLDEKIPGSGLINYRVNTEELRTIMVTKIIFMYLDQVRQEKVMVMENYQKLSYLKNLEEQLMVVLILVKK